MSHGRKIRDKGGWTRAGMKAIQKQKAVELPPKMMGEGRCAVV